MTEDPNDVFIYQIYCNVEAAYVRPIPRFRHQGAPTLCPNDHADRSNYVAPTVIGMQAKNAVTSHEPTNGIFEVKLYEFDVPAGAAASISDHYVSMPNNIEAWATAIDVTPETKGDRVTICVAPGAPIGVLTAPVASGTVISVPPATVNSPYVLVGAVIELYDAVGGQTQELGYLLAIDHDNYQLTVQTAVALSFPAGTVVRMYNYMLRDYLLSSVGFREFGRKGFRSKTIPSNTPILYRVQNNSGLAKTHYAHVEFYKA